MRYGFYEVPADYRADPIAVAFIFGLKSLEEIEAVFPGHLPQKLATHFTRDRCPGVSRDAHHFPRILSVARYLASKRREVA